MTEDGSALLVGVEDGFWMSSRRRADGERPTPGGDKTHSGWLEGGFGWVAAAVWSMVRLSCSAPAETIERWVVVGVNPWPSSEVSDGRAKDPAR